MELRVRGAAAARPAAGATSTKEGLGGQVTILRKAAYRFEATRSVGESVREPIAAGDVLRLELEGGLDLFVRGDRLGEVLPDAARARDGVVELDPTLAGSVASRGLGTLVIRALEIFGVDLMGAAATQIGEAFERKATATAGLRALSLSGGFQLAPGVATPGASERPLLVFLHGTGSNTEAAFGSLWQPDDRQALAALVPLYGERAYAFEHRSLTQSPVTNAIELVEALPEGARLHLVAHSRGGLIGELLCRGQRADGERPFAPGELDACYPADHPEREELARLGKLLADKRLRVERFVRVACPARGTTLASKRLDRWLSVVASLMKAVPHLRGLPLLDDFLDLVLALVARKADPDALPGLAAMMPHARLIRLLNHPKAESSADLTVIAGDSGGSSLWSRLKLLVPDLFFGGDHDLVVNTTSMYGGMRRVAGAGRFLLDHGAEVDHFRYFSNRRTVDAVVAGLTRRDGSDGGFVPIEQAARDERVPRRAVRGELGARPVVLVVPGIGGTHITVGGNRIWVDPFELAFGRGLGALRLDAEDVEPEALVGHVYGGLVAFLSETHDVVTVPFDWRRSLLDTAKDFAETLEKALDAGVRTHQPVRVVAHSMGGLLLRSAFALRPGLQQRLAELAGSRVLMLGTPNAGSWAIPRLLLGHERLLRAIAVLDLRLSSRDLLGILASFPGVLEMLPAPLPGERDLFDALSWDELARVEQRNGELAWVKPDPDRLRKARALRQDLEAVAPLPEVTLYLAGSAEKTPSGIEIDEAGGRVRFLATARGDGRVLWERGIPVDVRAWYAPTLHGDLPKDRTLFPALLDLLRNGSTDRLPTSPPAVARAVTDARPVVLEPDEMPLLPDANVLVDAALGGGAAGVEEQRAARRRTRSGHRVRVSVTHGDLAYARHVVAVGHYAGDTIVGAEDTLDRRLGNRLRRRRDLDLYPGPLGTSQVFLGGDAHAGALVIGLGRVGELTPRLLQAGIARAAVDFALALLEDERTRREPAGPVSAKLSSLLIGTGAGGMTVRQSVLAILRGVVEANVRLRAARLDSSVRIDVIEFIELWEDVAIEAARAMADCGAEDPALRAEIECEREIRAGKAGRRRTQFAEAPGWWDRLRIVADEKGGALRFTSISGRARNEVEMLATQRALLDAYLREVTDGVAQSRELARSLFEALLPLRLKDGSLEQRDLVLMLDRQSAGYPWELLEDGWVGDGEPLAVRSGVLRQLETVEFRAAPVSTVEDSALVVGDPATRYAPLPAAAEEARIVAERLRGDSFAVELRVGADTTSIHTALHARPYRVLHLAGHGVHEHLLEAGERRACETCGQLRAVPEDRISGLVLGGNAFLTPADVEKMRQVPELVFLNCCYLARMDQGASPPAVERHRLAANLAEQFVRMGARAVVAAGWQVEDRAAQLFAQTFYEHMLGGERFGRAVHRARRDVYDAFPALNTWGAYQCYGDPDYVLVRDGRRQSAPRRRSYAVPREAEIELENLAKRTEVARSEDLAELRQSLADLIKELREGHEKWLERADVLAAAGLAEAALGDFEAAIRHLEKARSSAGGAVTVRHLEQLANYRSRHAIAVAAREPKKAEKMCATALRELKQLLDLGPTSERWSLLGSAYKRQAWIARKRRAVRDRALRGMVEAYGKARDLAPGDHYPLQNWLCGRVVRCWLGAQDAKLAADAEDALAPAEEAAARLDRDDPTLWSGIASAELQLTRLLVGLLASSAADPSAWDSIGQAYLRALGRGASPRERRSIGEQLQFLEVMALEAGEQDLATAVVALRDRIEA